MMTIYTVQPGDTVGSIAERFEVPQSLIVTTNDLKDPEKLSVGQSLIIQFPEQTYTVEEGDTLQWIARGFSTTVDALQRNNPQLKGRETIYPGQTLVISYGQPPLGEIRVTGFAYPYISDDVLYRTLPYLTYLSIFSYGLNPDGTLVPPEGGGDQRLVDAAVDGGVIPLLVLTSLTADGTFSNALINTILADPALQQKVIANTVETVKRMGYGGVDVDFEYISPQYAQAYADFVRDLKSALGEEYTVLTDLAPKTSADQPELLYAGHNYAALGQAADDVLLMTYEWGYQFGPPLPVSPIDQVRRVIEYALTEIPAEKISIGIPTYGYDWTLPFERGSAAEPLSSQEAVARAYDKKAQIQYDTLAQAPYYTYWQRDPNGIPREHIVWFQDARSADALLRLVQEYGLNGAGIWNIMRWFPQVWAVLNQLYTIRKE